MSNIDERVLNFNAVRVSACRVYSDAFSEANMVQADAIDEAVFIEQRIFQKNTDEVHPAILQREHGRCNDYPSDRFSVVPF